MEFSKDFKAVWWFILICAIAYYLHSRLDELQAGNPSWFDALTFIVVTALAIGPFFKEMELPGIKLKQEVSDLKEKVTSELAAIRNTIQANNEQRQHTVITNGYPLPPIPDSQIPDFDDRIKQALAPYLDAIEKKSTEAPTAHQPTEATNNFGNPAVKYGSQPTAPADALALFTARYTIETKLREIFRSYHSSITARDTPYNKPIGKIVEILERHGVLTQDLGTVLQEVYTICSFAIHGNDISSAKLKLVNDNTPRIISALDLIIKNRMHENIQHSSLSRANTDNTKEPGEFCL